MSVLWFIALVFSFFPELSSMPWPSGFRRQALTVGVWSLNCNNNDIRKCDGKV